MAEQLRVAVAQMVSRLQDAEANLQEACRLSRDAAVQGARLLLLPEGCLTGNALSGRAQQATLPLTASAVAPLQAVADETGITICAGLATPFGEQVNIVHAIVRPHAPPLFQRKAFRASSEPAFLAPWPDPARVLFTVDGVRIAILICSEAGADAPREAALQARPDLVLHPSAGCLRPDQVARGEDDAERIEAFRREYRGVVERTGEQVRAWGVPKASANPIGHDGETWWPGNSFVLDARGAVCAWLHGENLPARMAPAVGVADLPLEAC